LLELRIALAVDDLDLYVRRVFLIAATNAGASFCTNRTVVKFGSIISTLPVSDGSGSRAAAGLMYAAAQPSPATTVIALVTDLISFPPPYC
jgi:hypothetical protein